MIIELTFYTLYTQNTSYVCGVTVYVSVKPYYKQITFLQIIYKRPCWAGHNYWVFHPGALSLAQVTATHFDRLMQETRNSIANAMELSLSGTNPSISRWGVHGFHLWVLDLQVSCRDTTTWQGTRIVAAMVARQHALLTSIAHPWGGGMGWVLFFVRSMSSHCNCFSVSSTMF